MKTLKYILNCKNMFWDQFSCQINEDEDEFVPSRLTEVI